MTFHSNDNKVKTYSNPSVSFASKLVSLNLNNGSELFRERLKSKLEETGGVACHIQVSKNDFYFCLLQNDENCWHSFLILKRSGNKNEHYHQIRRCRKTKWRSPTQMRRKIIGVKRRLTTMGRQNVKQCVFLEILVLQVNAMTLVTFLAVRVHLIISSTVCRCSVHKIRLQTPNIQNFLTTMLRIIPRHRPTSPGKGATWLWQLMRQTTMLWVLGRDEHPHLHRRRRRCLLQRTLQGVFMTLTPILLWVLTHNNFIWVLQAIAALARKNALEWGAPWQVQLLLLLPN